jgi:surfactin synthase thioesterase subunit
LRETARAPRRPRTSPAGEAVTLSPEKRRLLALLVRRKAAAEAWFPTVDARPQARLRLFCLPHAGGGAAAYYRWVEKLAPEVAVCPVRLPGRESRAAEPPFTRMAPLVEALAEAIGPFTAHPFALFGHSMGAGVAFELARELRQRGRPLPLRLLVSGARAPRCRLGWTPPPDPTRAELIGQLRRLDGIPRDALENDEVLRMILPALEADTALYRHWTYAAEPPLACPIHAFGGGSDPNVSREHLEDWQYETSCEFQLRMFPGGHFYLQTGEAELLAALEQTLVAAAA